MPSARWRQPVDSTKESTATSSRERLATQRSLVRTASSGDRRATGVAALRHRLHWRTWHVAPGTEDAAVAGFRAQNRFAFAAGEKDDAGIHRHGLRVPTAAM